MRVKLAWLASRFGEDYLLAQVPRDMEGAATHRVQSALAVQLDLGSPDRIVLMEGEPDARPTFSGPFDLLVDARARQPDRLVRSTTWVTRNIRVV
jgi:hypothetical protein